MEWETYLEQKKIDAEAFQKGDPAQYEAFSKTFYRMHPNSFTAQKLFLINGIRRTYPLIKKEPVKAAPKAVARPVFKPKPK